MPEQTLSVMIERARRWLVGTQGVPLNKLTTAIDDNDVDLRFDYALQPLVPGNYIAIDDELLYVWEIQSANKEATVSRAQLGTEAAAHSAGATVESFGRFPRPVIRDAIVDEIRSWPDTVYRVDAKSVLLPARTASVTLGISDDDLLAVLEVNRAPRDDLPWDTDRWTRMEFTVLRQMASVDFVRGTGLVVHRRHEEAIELRVLYSTPFRCDNIADTDDVISSWGLTSSMLDIPPLGAVWRLLHAREIQRTDTEAMGETRIPAEVPATHQTQTANAFKRLRDQRLSEEAARLQARYRTS